MAGIILCDTPEVSERADLFIIEMASGKDKIVIALTQRDICILASRSMETVDAVARRRQAAVIPFPIAQEGR